MTAPMAAKTCVRLGTSGPAPPLPWKDSSVDLLLRIGDLKKKKKKPPAACCSLVFSECGAGALGAFPFLLQHRTCTDSQGWLLLASLRTRARPLRSPRVEDDEACLALDLLLKTMGCLSGRT